MNTPNWKNATPEQLNLWNIAKTKIGYSSITPLYFMGSIAGSEFNTYDANKIYISLESIFSCTGGTNANFGEVTLYDEINVSRTIVANNAPFWQVTMAGDYFQINPVALKNVWFSRISGALYDVMIFNGYRLNV